MSRTLTFTLAAAADVALGDAPTRAHPVGLVGLAARTLRRWAPSDADERRRYGLRVAVALPLASALAVVTITRIVGRRSRVAGLYAEVALLSTTMSLRTLLRRATEVRVALDAGDLTRAQALAGRHLVSRDTAALKAGGVAAATIESVAENLSDGVVAPWLAYAAGGLPAAVAYRAANTLDALWGYRDGDLAELGQAAARLDDALNLVPARLTALALLTAAAVLRPEGYDPAGALAVWRTDASATESPNAGHPMAAMAGALGVALEKEGAYTLGAGLPVPVAADIGRAVRLASAAAVIAGAGMLGALVALELAR